MKSIFRITIYCIMLFAVPFSNLFSGDWKKVTTASMESLYSIRFIDHSLGFAAGAYGTIYKSTNGGAEWKEIYRDIKAGDLNEIFFLNNNTGFIAGDLGRILKTTDSGNSWNAISMGDSTKEIKSIYFQDEMNGWILVSEYGILHTTDGGAKWTNVQPLTGIKMNKFHFWNKNHAVAVGPSATEIYYTADGISWTKSKSAPFGGFTYTKFDIKNVYAADNNNVYAVGYGTIVGMQPSILLKSSDAGATWEFSVQDSSDRTYETLYALWFKDANNGVAVGGGSRGSVFLRTSDGGKTWKPMDIASGVTLNTLSGLDNELWISGSGGVIMHSTDFGTSWQYQSKIPGVNLTSILFASDKVGYAAGYDGAFFKTKDGGKSWDAKFLRINKVSLYVQDMFFINDNVGYATFSNRMIAKTTDGGNTWKAVLPDLMDFNQICYGLYFFNELSGYVVGKVGNKIDAIYKTTDGGQNWDIKTNILKANLKDVAFGNEKTGAIVADGFKGLYTTDGGETWNISKFNNVPAGRTPNIVKVEFLSPTDAVAIGSACMLKSSDGGANWNWITTEGLIENLTGLSFFTSLKGWAVGTSTGTSASPKKLGIYETNDGGASWAYITDTTVFNYKETITGVGADKSGKLWICSPKGTIFTNNPTVGVNRSKDQMPKDFALQQNYPNPFNPSTVIEYSLPEFSSVSLNVYDMLGRQVAKLLNEYQGAGAHKVNFNASGLPSGIYFYSLNANGRVMTRKMSVIK